MTKARQAFLQATVQNPLGLRDNKDPAGDTFMCVRPARDSALRHGDHQMDFLHTAGETLKLLHAAWVRKEVFVR